LQDPVASSFPALKPEDVTQLQELIKSHCGLRVDAVKLDHSLYRAWPTLVAMGVGEVPALVRQLAANAPRLWAAFLPFLTINETYFLREPKQLEDFVELAVPELRARAAGRAAPGLRVLSAACSTGEEVYTLAMLMTDAGVRGRVLGVDIDPEALAIAEGASYGPNSFRGVDPAWRAQRFAEVGANRWQVSASYRELASFQRVNLLAAETALAGQRFDAIFCRNVLIYFDRPTQLSVLQQLRRMLVPGGYLFLGHSEMFFDVDLGLEVKSTARSTMYQLAEQARPEGTGGLGGPRWP
jgi:chemotaxis protein methyltransferase CheR